MNEKKMIIRNCPAFDSKYNECHSKIEPHKLYCMDCTNCVMKRIVEKCKRTLSINKGSDNEFTLGKMTFAEFILKDIDIQEVE